MRKGTIPVAAILLSLALAPGGLPSLAAQGPTVRRVSSDEVEIEATGLGRPRSGTSGPVGRRQEAFVAAYCDALGNMVELGVTEASVSPTNDTIRAAAPKTNIGPF